MFGLPGLSFDNKKGLGQTAIIQISAIVHCSFAPCKLFSPLLALTAPTLTRDWLSSKGWVHEHIQVHKKFIFVYLLYSTGVGYSISFVSKFKKARSLSNNTMERLTIESIMQIRRIILLRTKIKWKKKEKKPAYKVTFIPKIFTFWPFQKRGPDPVIAKPPPPSPLDLCI